MAIEPSPQLDMRHGPAAGSVRRGGPDAYLAAVLVDGPSVAAPSYRRFLEALGVAVYTTDAEGRITFYNEAAAEFWGRDPELGELWCGSFRLFWPDGRPMAHDECPMAIALKEGRSVRGYEAIVERPDGSRASFVPYPTIVRDESGVITGAVNVLVDVTERRLAEEAARRSERELADFFETAAIGLHWVGPDGMILRVNQAELDLLGYRREEYVGRPIAEFHVDQPVIEDILARLRRGEAVHEYPAQLRRKDGAIRDVLISSSALFQDGQFVHTRCFTQDVTERKAAEAALRASEKALRQAHENYRALVWSTADSVWEADGKGAIDIVSPAWQRLTGQALDSWLGSGWLKVLHPDDRDRVHQEWRTRVADRAPIELDFRVRDRTGDWRWISARAAPTVGEDGVTPRWIGMYTDVTRRKRAEEAREGFVGVMSHELRTPITTILGMAELLARHEREPGDTTAHGMIQDVAEEARRLYRLVEDLLVLSRAERSELAVETEPVLVHHAITAAVADEAERYPAYHFRYDGVPLPPVLADSTYVHQILRNFLSNAAKYGEKGGEIAVVASHDQGEVVVRVMDEGPGLPPGDPNHLFDLFYRAPESKHRQPGVGIGLFVVRSLVEAMGGRVWAKARTPRGSEFGFSLPVARSD
jgi:PAS domain S-box-containing protein